MEPIILSVQIAVISTIITGMMGILAAYVMTHYRFFGQGFLETLFMMPLVLPPSVTGYLLLVFFGRTSGLGGLLYDYFGIQIVFTWWAAIIAAVIVTFPLMYQSVKSAFQHIDPDYHDAAITLGASKKKVLFTITLPLALSGILAGVVMSFARALGEFGATLMVAGNIPGKTQTMPVAIYSAVESGNTELANQYVVIMTALSFLLVLSLNLWHKKNHYIEIIKQSK